MRSCHFKLQQQLPPQCLPLNYNVAIGYSKRAFFLPPSGKQFCNSRDSVGSGGTLFCPRLRTDDYGCASGTCLFTPQLLQSLESHSRLIGMDGVQSKCASSTARVRISVRVRGSSQNGGDNGSLNGSRKGADLFAEEEIGAEHGEGFATFRPRGPLHVDVDYLNDRMRERGLQRIRYAMKPDEAFGLIYSWDNVLADTRSLRMEAWNRLAIEEGYVIDNDPEKHRLMLTMTAERVLEQVLNWGAAGADLKRRTQRLAELYLEGLARVRAPMEGLREWLEALDTAGVPCAVASTLDRLTLLAALQRMGLRKYFQAVVSEEDGMESIAHRYLSAAVKLDRPPFKCVVFEDDPRGITAAHNCTMKAVALIGSHPAYELTQADLAVSSFTELSVINLRRLFANKGTEFMDLQLQPEEKKPRRRKLTNDTLF